MADHHLQDRQDVPIWNAIEANNYKQALKLVDKRLSKKRSDYLEALKIYIRAKSPVLPEKGAVIIHLEELVEKKKVVADQETLELYDEALREVLPEAEGQWERIIGELRWLCVKGQPKNEDLSLKCFQACLRMSDLEHAKQCTDLVVVAKISNSLEKTFSKNHAYVFWNIATMFLYSTSTHYPEKQRKLWGSLAFAQIGKLAASTREAKDMQQLPIRSIQTPQELLLLHRITKALGRPDQRTEYLNDATLGPESTVAKGEWEMWRFKLDLLQSGEKWSELYELTQALLKRARTPDESGTLTESGMSDWAVWQAFIRAAVQESKHKDAVMTEIEAHLDPACKIDKSWKRNASLAWVKFSFESSNPFQDQSQHRVPVIIKYLQKYGSASTAYNDLRPFVEQLTAVERKELLDNLLRHEIFGEIEEDKNFKTAKKTTELINTYKLQYLLTSSILEIESLESQKFKAGHQDIADRFSVPSLRQLAKESAGLYFAAASGGRAAWNLLPTDTHPADDLCLISAMCLIKLALASPEKSELLASSKASYISQAAALLEYALTHSQPNFQMSLLLIRLYSYLGCGSLAMHAYQRLNLKQIQLDTLSYTLFDRISTFHPHPFGHTVSDSTQYRTPIESLQKQQKMYRGSRSQISKNVWLSYKNGSYNSIFEIEEVSSILSRTLARVMSSIESNNIAQLIPVKADAGSAGDKPRKSSLSTFAGNNLINEVSLPEDSEPLVDTNDYETFPNFECTLGMRFEELCRFVPGPSNYRTRINLAAEKLKSLLEPPPKTTGSQGQALSEAVLKNYLFSESLPNSPPRFRKEDSRTLTHAEELARQSYDAMHLIILDSCDQERWSDQNFQKRLESYNEDLCASLDDQITHFQKDTLALSGTLHTLYTSYDIAQTVLKLCAFLKARAKAIPESQLESNKKIAEAAQRLLQAVVEKSGAVKQQFDEGGWIDRILDSVLQGPDSVLGELRESVDEGHLEVWAGDVVESLRDTVAGLSYLKMPGK